MADFVIEVGHCLTKAMLEDVALIRLSSQQNDEKCRKTGIIRVEAARIRVKVLREYDFGVLK